MTAVTDPTSIPAAPIQRKTPKGTFDIIFRNASFVSALFVLVLLAGIMLSMVIGGWPSTSSIPCTGGSLNSCSFGTSRPGAIMPSVVA